MRRREHGSVAVVTTGAVALAVVLMIGIARVGSAAVVRARADSAADAAALAAADALASGKSSGDAMADAADTARANGARLVSCDCAGTAAEVVVVADPGAVKGRARAEVDVGKMFVSSP
jgi:secretion/DNA translocation related TadE-like protein